MVLLKGQFTVKLYLSHALLILVLFKCMPSFIYGPREDFFF